ncbi:MAG TPA: GeoRSP system SPASM domain protein [Geobacteraceae bacterium]
MELATPITIYWDLPSRTLDTGRLLRICGDIVDCRPLMLHLHLPDPQLDEGTLAVLERLKGTSIAVSLTVPPEALGLAGSTLLRDLGLKEMLVEVGQVAALSPGTLSGLLFLSQESASAAPRPTPGIAFPVCRDNWRELPKLLACCRSEGVPRLILPMQRLYHGESPFNLTRREQEELAASLAKAGGVEGVNLTVHDPFLWRALNPGVPFPQGGCQAANTMIAVDPDGAVYPCPSLPVRLGDIGETSLKAIIASAAKKDFRRRLLESPAGCRACAELAECRGGCRGRAFVIYGSLDGIDVACE